MWTVDELGREAGDKTTTIDAVARLYGDGLLHRCNEFVFATRAAMRLHALPTL